MQQAECRLSVQNLYVNHGTVKTLFNVSLDVRAGEIVALIGTNGAGKSTLLNALAGSIRHARGQILYQGQDISTWPDYRRARAGLVLVPEGRGVFASLRVDENLLMGTGYAQQRESRYHLEYVYTLWPCLYEKRALSAGSLSGGEQQMLVIARALMLRPVVLMLDEPSLGLSPVVVDMIMDRLIAVVQDGVSLLLVEQNATLALSISNEAYVLETGRVTLSGCSKVLMHSTHIQSAYLGLVHKR